MATRGHKHIQISLLLIIFFSLAAATTLADGCCVPTPDIGGSCLGEDYLDPLQNNVEITEESCEGVEGRTWETINCTELPECDEGCCCASAIGWDYGANASCEGDATFVAAQSEDECQSECTVKADYRVTGYVVDGDGEPLPGVNVTVDNPSLTKEAGSDGSYEFTAVEHGDRIFTVQNETCMDSEYPYIDHDINDYSYNLTLDCTDGGDGQPDCTPEWDCYFVPADPDACGKRYDKCDDASECTDLSYVDYYEQIHGETRPLPYKACDVTPSDCNPDGKLEEGEACDAGGSSPIYRDGNTCQDYGYAAGTLNCVDCDIDFTGCDFCPTNPTSCTEAQCAECEACQGVCGGTDCLDEKPELQSVTYPEMTDEVRLNWRFEPATCLDTLDSFTISVTTQANDGTETSYKTLHITPQTHNDVFDPGSTTFTYEGFDGLDPKTTYCYRVEAHLEENGQTATTTSDKTCKPTGDEECMQPHPHEFCVDDARNRCTTGNSLEEIDDCGDEELLCFGPDANGQTRCSDLTACQFCNGPFGMYGYLTQQKSPNSFEVPYNNGEEEIETRCVDIKLYDHPLDIPICRDDRTETVTDQLSTCAAVHTCYDYTTKGSCTDNQCNKEGLEDCEWHAFPDEESELGLGVCAPADGEPDCGRCNEDDHILPACTENLCGLYATSDGPNGTCYYSTTDGGSEGQCLSRDEASCASYNDREDCTGLRPYEVNVTYSTEPGYEEVRVNGTHQRHQLTDDPFGYGVCDWTSEGCIKDADDDDDLAGDCTPKTTQDYPDCVRDTKPPITEAGLVDPADQPWSEQHPVYSANNLFTFHANDNLFPEGDVDTYIWYNKTHKPYPSSLQTSSFGASFAQTLEGTYNVAYYSVDGSKNLEEVRHEKITFDNTPPQLTHNSTTNNSFLIAEDEWRTNLTINYVITEPHGPVTCTGTLHHAHDTEGKLGGDRTSYTTEASGPYEFEQSYFQLKDGTYRFTLECADNTFLNNTHTYINTYTIDADQSITNPTPHRDIFQGDKEKVEISIETQKNATCYYSAETSEPYTDRINPDVEGFNTEDNKIHTATITVEPGLYYYHTGCKFIDDKVTEGNRADMILFSVDDQPPETTLLNALTDQPFQPPYYNDTRDVTFDARDEDYNLILQTETGNILWNGNAQGVTTHYCLNYNNQTDSCDDYTTWTGGGLSFNADDTTGTQLHFYSEDGLGNTEAEKVANLFLRNLDVYVQGVWICTSEGECFVSTPQSVE